MYASNWNSPIKKHILVMYVLNQCYKNAKILFRSNGVSNAFDNRNILGAFESKKHKAGEFFKIENNYYSVDSFNNRSTWGKTDFDYNFAIVYPIDAITRKSTDLKCIEDLFNNKDIDKIFLVSWTDHNHDDVAIYDKFIDSKTIYDVEEEDIHYHNRVLGIE